MSTLVLLWQYSHRFLSACAGHKKR